MKIAFVIFDLSQYGGVESVVANLTNELAQDEEIHIIGLCGRQDQMPVPLNKKIICHEMNLKKERIRHMMKTCKLPLKKLFSEQQYDIILSEGHFSGLLLMMFRFRTKSKLVFCDHGSLMSQWRSRGKTLGRFFMAHLYHKTVVLTERSREAYIQKLHISSRKVVCIYNWLDEKFLEQSQEYKADSSYILSVGRFGKEKGYDMLVRVAAKVLPRYPDWQWHVYGNGETFDEIKKKTEEEKLSRQLILKGAVPDIIKRYRDYAMLVLPSYREGLPLVLLEAQANHLPIVSFDITTGPGEIVSNGKNGYLIPEYDLDDMADKIALLIEDREKRIAFAAHARDNLERFGTAAILKQWKNLFGELTGKRT